MIECYCDFEVKGQLSLSGSKANSLFVPQLCLRFGGRMENPANHPEMGFIWECDGSSFEEKNVLEDSLLEGYQYKINKFKIIEKSDIKEEIKFQAEVCVNICDKEEALRFIKSISTKNDIDMRPSRKDMMRKGFESQRYNCSRKIKRN